MELYHDLLQKAIEVLFELTCRAIGTLGEKITCVVYLKNHLKVMLGM